MGRAPCHEATGEGWARKPSSRSSTSGGDADTNGAIAGALLGAKFGRNQIPERWLKATQAVPRMNDLGDRLLKLAGGK